MKPGKYGYRWEPSANGLVRDPAEQQTIALVRELQTAGWLFRDIADELNRRGILTRTGKQWTARNLISAMHRVWPETRMQQAQEQSGQSAAVKAPVGKSSLGDQTERQVVALIWELQSSGTGYADVAAELNRRGIRTRRGKPWAYGSVFRVIRCLPPIVPRVEAGRTMSLQLS